MAALRGVFLLHVRVCMCDASKLQERLKSKRLVDEQPTALVTDAEVSPPEEIPRKLGQN